MRPLRAFWIARSPFDSAGIAERFGITAFSLADALDILVWAGVRIRANRGPFVVVAVVDYRDLVEQPGFRSHVEYNMGPIVCRSLWYPWISSQPPAPRAMRPDDTMSLPPPQKLAACLAVLECAAIRLRLLGYAGEKEGMAPSDAAEVAVLADAVHHLPYLIQHWDTCDEELLRGMLHDYDNRFPSGHSLVAAYERAEAAAG
ncbi:hypothetical protein [Polyangium sp. y55x31]|uniref:hypothetical protein n=1 Tax=Polyangium sp. y55x31 TaxID=3042688 RepID=UPI0024827265|nr:hypothetical protein [Polyangium sp. y55x31]MDI1476864.1 hypothetical protein [Polyangium sp. y55x31]